ncbi:ABC transporter substrate binding protein [Methanolobus mangrovi]|uniref:histidine kinase n=1 Tax=Methanolobus mangrovi TaxID=3072977 RepID=A0AA51UF76_9EURY|nr:ABC transporter substrate binding protein [Methanolobus mangrovi]WMW22124.1 ABC transporter substrate binding protein [Methanolobus mangrovi]
MITQGILDVFKDSEYSNAEIYFEYMDAKRHPDKEYIDSLADVYRQKYKNHDEFGLIICADNYAIDFLTSEAGLEIFSPDIPVVFCGANDYDPMWRENRSLMTGIVEHIEPAETLDLILELHPDTKRLLVVRDNNSHTSLITTEQAKKEFQPYEDKLQIEYLEDMTVLQMQETVANVSDDTVIFLLLFSRDKAGNEVTMTESINAIADVSSVPVYSVWEFYLGNGIVGGKLTSAENEGRLAGEYALRVLDGEGADELPVLESQYHDFMFDWNQMERFSISESSLPAGSILINKDLSFFEEYQKELLVIFIALVLQFILIAFLLVNRQVLKTTEAELLVAKDKAEEADLLKSRFLANISHELRTPLNGILGFSEMIQFGNISEEKCTHYAGLIKKSGEQLLLIIDDILDISKIEANQLDLHNEAFNVNHMLDDLYSLFKVQFELKEPPIELILVKELDDMGSFLYSDEHRIRQIFNNIIGNALKFTHEGSVEFGYSVNDEYMEFYVKDTGIGVPEDKYDCIFGRFRQVNDASTRKYKGTGLGMSISKSLAELLGGNIRFESEVGVGTTFYFSIPFVHVPV